MKRRTYTRDDVQTHSDGWVRGSSPAVNVKVYKDLRDAWDEFVKEEEPDPRFTLEWIEEHVREDSEWFEIACESEYEYFEGWATGADDDGLFPDHRVTLNREGRSVGWITVDGLPELEEWDVVLLARWRKFERIAREIADGIPFQMLSLIYLNAFEPWADEQADESVSNAEAPVDLVIGWQPRYGYAPLDHRFYGRPA